MKRIEKLRKQLSDIECEIASLANFRKTLQFQKFLRQLHGERSVILASMKEALASKASKKETRSQKVGLANKNRSEKMKRSWRYFRSIQDTYYPEKSLKEIRSLFSKAKRGLETEIPDVAWRNPSP
jgi:hypothetical protein